MIQPDQQQHGQQGLKAILFGFLLVVVGIVATQGLYLAGVMLMTFSGLGRRSTVTMVSLPITGVLIGVAIIVTGVVIAFRGYRHRE
jgi:hypothetical protein